MTATHPPDSQHQGFLALLPAGLRPYALLARFDRPIGWWLLYWPCAWGLALGGGARSHWPLFFWMLLGRSEEHTSELQSLMRISYAVFCLKKKKKTINPVHQDTTK